MWCKWCGEPIPEVIDGKRSTQRYWHPACAEEFNLHTRLEVQRPFVIRRDGEKCAICGEAPMRWLRGEVARVLDWSRGTVSLDFLRELWSASDFEGLRTFDPLTGRHIGHPDAWMLQGGQCSVELVSALDLDHRVPLWSVADLPDEERRWYFGPGNLWLMCPRHHKQKTKREAAERAALRAFEKAQRSLPL
ncbi:MAG: hypothetical protein ACJ8DZ_13910 [Allosphingosinicella sp.]